jgi:phosphate uptake regulator
MKRKVIRQANQAHTITLPIDWVRQNALTAGSELDVNVVDRSLIISTGGKMALTTAAIDANNLSDRALQIHISALYSRGVDEITVRSRKDIATLIVHALQQNVGYALVGHDGDAYTIRDIGGANYEDLDGIYKHTFHSIISYAQDAINDTFGKRSETHESLKARDREINKLCFYLQRAVAKMAYPDATQSKVMFASAYQLEKVADNIERFWRDAILHKKAVPGLKPVAQHALATLHAAFALRYQFKGKDVDTIFELRNKTRESWLRLKQDEPTLIIGRHIVRLAEEAADLNHLTLMRRL